MPLIGSPDIAPQLGIKSADILQFFNLFTGVMQDQPVNFKHQLLVGGGNTINAATPVLTVKGVAVQSGDLILAQDNLGNPLFEVGPTGSMIQHGATSVTTGTGGVTVAGGGLTVTAGGLQVTAGNVGIGGAPISQSGVQMPVAYSIMAAGGSAQGINVQTTLVASANNDGLNGISASPTFSANTKTGTIQRSLVLTPSFDQATAATWQSLVIGVNSQANAGSTKYGIFLDSQTGANANNYGLYVNAPSGGSGDNLSIKAAGVVHVGGGGSIGTTNSGLVIDNGANPAPITSGNGVSFGSQTFATASAGANAAPPAQVAGYVAFNVGGTPHKIPYYNN